jgi:hypothetical protein
MSTNIRRFLIIFCCLALLADVLLLALAKKAKRFEAVSLPVKYRLKAWIASEAQLDNLLQKIKGRAFRVKSKNNLDHEEKVPTGYIVIQENKNPETTNSVAKLLRDKGYQVTCYKNNLNAVVQLGGIFLNKEEAQSKVQQVLLNHHIRFSVATNYHSVTVKRYCLIIDDLNKDDLNWLQLKLKKGAEDIEINKII